MYRENRRLLCGVSHGCKQLGVGELTVYKPNQNQTLKNEASSRAHARGALAHSCGANAIASSKNWHQRMRMHGARSNTTFLREADVGLPPRSTLRAERGPFRNKLMWLSSRARTSRARLMWWHAHAHASHTRLMWWRVRAHASRARLMWWLSRAHLCTRDTNTNHTSPAP